MYWLLLLCIAAAPFWETKPPATWSDAELRALLTSSPWAQVVPAVGPAAAPPIQVYLATAAPILLAEHERDLRMQRRRPAGTPPVQDPFAEDYRDWLEQHRATAIVVAVYIADDKAFSDEKETRQMEEQCIMHVGRKKFKMTGHFPPSSSDPYLRLAFPREVSATDKSVSFDLYVPGVTLPFREVEFKVKDLLMNGKPEL